VFTYIIVHGPRAQTPAGAPRLITLIFRIAEKTGGIFRLAKTSHDHHTSISTVSHGFVYVPIVRTLHIVKVATVSHMVKMSTFPILLKFPLFPILLKFHILVLVIRYLNTT